jgi:hypothetical protein
MSLIGVLNVFMEKPFTPLYGSLTKPDMHTECTTATPEGKEPWRSQPNPTERTTSRQSAATSLTMNATNRPCFSVSPDSASQHR